MVAPRAAIWIPPSNGVGAYADAMHVHPTQIFYKSSAHCTSWLTFGQPQVWDTSWTTTLAVGAAEHLVQVNKRISLVAYFCPPS